MGMSVRNGPDIRTFHQIEGPTGVGAFTLAIDIKRFMPPVQFTALSQNYVASIKASKKASGANRSYLPG
jgi:LDH2 family malate/lactate/ureidoglycolate dehydrogenase